MPTKKQLRNGWRVAFLLNNNGVSSNDKDKTIKKGTEIGSIKFSDGELKVEFDKK